MSKDLEQIAIEGFTGELPQEDETVAELREGKSPGEIMISELFQDPTPLSDIKKGKFISNPRPDEVKKSRSQIIDEVIAAKDNHTGELSLEKEETFGINSDPLVTRVSLLFDNSIDDVVNYSRVLTNFDREVIDAVSTLATVTQVMTAATIYRMITGKSDDSPVNQSQKKRVEDSMNRCARCQVTIDVTSEYRNHPMLAGSDEDDFWYIGNAISYEAIKHQAKRGTTIYYRINSLPPFYRFAERLGKISVFPLKLLDSPVSKTDNIIAVQSYLLRTIDSMKQDRSISNCIDWDVIYKMATQEGKQATANENKRTRDNILRILDFWIEENFIKSYSSRPRTGVIEFEF